MTEAKYIKRMIFLETVAGVPGMVGAMIRHMKSLGNLREDGGWIHHLMEEAENERMHLLTFLQLKSPGIVFRINVLLVQWMFLIGFSSVYALSPKTANRFVGKFCTGTLWAPWLSSLFPRCQNPCQSHRITFSILVCRVCIRGELSRMNNEVWFWRSATCGGGVGPDAGTGSGPGGAAGFRTSPNHHVL